MARRQRHLHVALSNGPYDWAANREAALVRRGVPYLQPVWGTEHGSFMP